MEYAPSATSTDSRREQDHLKIFPDTIGNFALGVGSVKKQHVVVDIHTGDNGISPKLNGTGAKVIAIDQGKALGLKLNGGPAEGRGMEFDNDASGLMLPMGPRSVDIVFVDLVLHHMQTPAQAIMEIKRILKPGGRLVITDIQKYSDGEFQTALRGKWMGFYPGDLRHWMKSAGFSNIIVNPVPTRYISPRSAVERRMTSIGFLIATGTA